LPDSLALILSLTDFLLLNGKLQNILRDILLEKFQFLKLPRDVFMNPYPLSDSLLEEQVNFMEALLLKLLKLINGSNLLILNFNLILVQFTMLFLDLLLQLKRNMMKLKKAYLKS
jgi:hypothetical protein